MRQHEDSFAQPETGYVNKFSLIRCNLFVFDSICIPICPSVVFSSSLRSTAFSCIDLYSIFFRIGCECSVKSPSKQSLCEPKMGFGSFFSVVPLILCAQFTKNLTLCRCSGKKNEAKREKKSQTVIECLV